MFHNWRQYHQILEGLYTCINSKYIASHLKKKSVLMKKIIELQSANSDPPKKTLLHQNTGK